MTSLPSSFFEEILRRSSKIKGVFLGFNLNIDVLVPLSENKLLLKALEKEFKEGESVSEIKDLGDLSLATYLSFSKGMAAEYLIPEEIHESISKLVSKFEERVGGPVGIVGNVLAELGIRCLIHGPSFSPRQVKVLRKELEMVRGGSFSQIEEDPGDPDLVHWIFEFKRGEIGKFGNKVVRAPRENRVIFSYDWLNSKMYIREEYKRASRKIGEEFPLAIISGYHLLTPRVNYSERLREGSKFLEDLSSSGCLIHSEMAFNPFPEVRKEILKRMVRKSDSLGLNEVEFSLLCEDLGIASQEEALKPENFAKYCIDLAEELGIDRIHLHTYGLYVECVKEGGKFSPDKIALEISSIFAATKAKLGDIHSYEDLKVGERVPKYVAAEKISKRLDGVKGKGYQIVAISSRIVEDPKATVGLGDIISSSAFLFRVRDE